MKNFLSEIVFSSKEQSRQITQQLKAGLLRKIAPKIYTTTLCFGYDNFIKEFF